MYFLFFFMLTVFLSRVKLLPGLATVAICSAEVLLKPKTE